LNYDTGKILEIRQPKPSKTKANSLNLNTLLTPHQTKIYGMNSQLLILLLKICHTIQPKGDQPPVDPKRKTKKHKPNIQRFYNKIATL
jgi:hypothetical protein